MNRKAILVGGVETKRDLTSRSAPPAAVAPLVEAFAGRDAVVPRACFRVFPTARAELIFHFGDPFHVAEAPTAPMRPLAPVVLLGPRLHSYWQSAGPRIDWFMVQLTPLGCLRLLGLPFAEAWHREIPLADLWGQRASELHEQLASLATFEARQAFMLDKIGGRTPADRMNIAGRLIRDGRIRSVDRLAAYLQVGPRRLHQKFVADYGVGPKTMLSVIRFGRQLEARHPLGEHSSGLDYADDSHAIREFRRFAGMTPGDYVRQKQAGDRLVYTGAPLSVGEGGIVQM